jgi:PIN domain
MSTSVSPERVYLDANILFRLGPRLENVDFEKLLELREGAGFGVFVAKPSWLEYLRWRKEEISAFLESCQKVHRALENQGTSIPEVANAQAKVEGYLSRIDEHYRAKAAKRGIAIIPLVGVDNERLLAMSLSQRPPFEQALDSSKRPRDRGFRDALIMFSVLEDIRAHSVRSAIVITQDGLLAKAFDENTEASCAALILKSSLDEATAYLNEVIADSERLRIKRESADAIKTLLPYEEDIARAVSDIAELTERDLGQGFIWSLLAKADQESLDIKAIKSIQFEKIDSAIWKDKGHTTSRVLFRCVCKAVVFVRAPYRPSMLAEPRRFKVGELPPKESFLTYTATHWQDYEPTEERELPFRVYGVAELERVGSEWKLARLRIDKSVPSEEYDALIAAELPTETRVDE